MILMQMTLLASSTEEIDEFGEGQCSSRETKLLNLNARNLCK